MAQIECRDRLPSTSCCLSSFLFDIDPRALKKETNKTVDRFDYRIPCRKKRVEDDVGVRVADHVYVTKKENVSAIVEGLQFGLVQFLTTTPMRTRPKFGIVIWAYDGFDLY